MAIYHKALWGLHPPFVPSFLSHYITEGLNYIIELKFYDQYDWSVSGHLIRCPLI